MEYFSNSKPELLSSNIKKKFKTFNPKKISNDFIITDNFTDSLMFFLKEYIEPNKFLLIFIVLIIVYLYHRYENKKRNKLNKNNKKNTENFRADDLNQLRKEIKAQTKDLEDNQQPTFNPLYPVSKQHEPVNYPPKRIPLRIDGKFHMVRPDDLYKKPQSQNSMIDPQYDYQIPHINNSRNLYTGVTNTYLNEPDTTIINPLGYPNNQVSTDADFVTGMTNANFINFKNFTNQKQDTSKTLIDNISSSDIEPPFSDEISFDY